MKSLKQTRNQNIDFSEGHKFFCVEKIERKRIHNEPFLVSLKPISQIGVDWTQNLCHHVLKLYLCFLATRVVYMLDCAVQVESTVPRAIGASMLREFKRCFWAKL